MQVDAPVTSASDFHKPTHARTPQTKYKRQSMEAGQHALYVKEETGSLIRH